MFRQANSVNLRRIVLVALVAMAALFVWYLLTHGRLITPSAGESTPVSYSRLQDSLNRAPGITASESTITPTGVYSVSTGDTDGNRYIRNITVGRLLQPTAAQGTVKPNRLSTLGRNALSQITQSARGLSTYEGSVFRLIEPSNITNENFKEFELAALPEFVDHIQLDHQTLVGFEETNGGVQPIRYNTVSQSVTIYPIISEVSQNNVTLLEAGERFALFNQSDSMLSIYGPASEVVDVSIGAADNITRNNGVPVISLSSNRLAVITGPDFVSSNDTADDLEGGDWTVSVIDISSKKILNKLTFKAPVTKVSLSPSGSRLAVTTDSQTGFFDANSSEHLFAIPHAIDDLRWANDERFIFSTALEGIFSGSLAKKTAATLVSYQDVRPTALGFIQDGQLFFTGYSESIANAEYPDSYAVSLTDKATKADLNAVRAFPHQGRGFYTDFLSGTATVQLTRYISDGSVSIDESARKAAIDYITRKVADYPREKIRFTYVDLTF